MIFSVRPSHRVLVLSRTQRPVGTGGGRPVFSRAPGLIWKALHWQGGAPVAPNNPFLPPISPFSPLLWFPVRLPFEIFFLGGGVKSGLPPLLRLSVERADGELGSRDRKPGLREAKAFCVPLETIGGCCTAAPLDLPSPAAVVSCVKHSALGGFFL